MIPARVIDARPYTDKSHTSFVVGEVVSAATPRRESLLYKATKTAATAICVLCLVVLAKADAMLDSIERGNAQVYRLVQEIVSSAQAEERARQIESQRTADRASSLASMFDSAVYSGSWRKTIEVVEEMVGTSEPEKAGGYGNLRFAMLYWNLGESNRAIRHMTFCVDQLAEEAQRYGRENRGVKRAQVLLEKMKRGAIPGKFSVNDITGYNQPSVLSFIMRPINDAIGAYYQKQTAHLDRLNAAMDAEIDVYRKEGRHQAMMATFNAEMDYLRSVNKTFDPDNQPPRGSADREKWDECKRIYDIFCTKESGNPSTTSTTFSSSTDSSSKPSYGESNQKKRASADACSSIRDAGHEGVQLWEGGLYWATTNIGADKPEDCGLYFWWGDTVGYRPSGGSFGYNFNNCPTYNKSVSTLQSEGWITSSGVLAPSHDAAHMHWGGGWRMPTYQELYDLCYNKCDWTWTTLNGVNGYIVRGRGAYASNSIFLPCAGLGVGTSLIDAGSDGYYWSSVPRSGNDFAGSLNFTSGDRDSSYYYYRSRGQSVRPVRGSAQ